MSIVIFYQEIYLLFISQFVDLGSSFGTEISSQCERVRIGNQSVFFLKFIHSVCRRLTIYTVDDSIVQSLCLQKSLKNLNL